MRYSVLFIIALILVSGFIAYFGDILGRRMGKKRLTLLNLRPRYTAIVVTTITGMLISALAVITLLSVDKKFREVMSQGEKIFDRNVQLQRTNLDLVGKNRFLVNRSEELQRLVDKRKKDLDNAKRQVASAKKQVDEARRAKDRAAEDVARLRSDIYLLQSRKQVVDYDLDAKTEELNLVQKQLDQTKKNLEVAENKFNDATAQLKVVQRQLAEAKAQVSEQEAAIKAQQQTLMEQQAALVKKGLEAMQFKALSTEFLRQNVELRSGDLVLRQGDEITRGVIPSNQSVFGARADLISLLEEASGKAEKRGAKIGLSGRAVSVVFRSADASVIDTNEDVCLRNAAEAICRSPVDALVQVVCARNSVAGEQALVELVLYFNKLVYRKGDKIASTRIDGFMSEGRVLLAVIEFLQEGVAESAMRKGIVPVANYDPSKSLGGDPQKQLQGLLTVVDKIRSRKLEVDVTVYACADIYAAGPLNMDNMRFSVAKNE